MLPNTSTPNKTLENLFSLADNIYALRYALTLGSYLFDNDNPYQNIVFKTYFCGEPRLYSSLNIPLVASQTYPNTLNGLLVYGCNYIIHCRELPNIYDLDGRQIYEGSNGTLFVYRYVPSSPGHLFDEALICPPRIEFAESKDLHFVYSKASELLVSQLSQQLNLEDELTKLTIINRITELQMQAYLQGRGYKDSMYLSGDATEMTSEEAPPEVNT